jgi:spore coat polysaccharide biosynthesis protein SpsF
MDYLPFEEIMADLKRNVVVIIQARMNSSRLPGKVLKDLGGRPELAWVVQRCQRAQQVQQVAVATTDDLADDPIESLCREHGWAIYRGSQFDVLDRFYQAARSLHADVIVRVTGDCPLMDPDLIDQVLDEYFQTGAEFAATRLPPPWKRTYPIGLDIEVCSFAGLERAWKEAVEPHEREHVMPYFYDQPGRFKTHILSYDPDYGQYRWTLDTPEDLILLRALFARLPDPLRATWLDVVALVESEPELSQINANVKHKMGTETDSRMASKGVASQRS